MDIVRLYESLTISLVLPRNLLLRNVAKTRTSFTDYNSSVNVKILSYLCGKCQETL